MFGVGVCTWLHVTHNIILLKYDTDIYQIAVRWWQLHIHVTIVILE